MTTRPDLLAAYDAQLRMLIPRRLPANVRYDVQGSVLRVVGRRQGFVETARDVGVAGGELDALIAEHRDFFAARGEEVEWKTRGHDLPAELPSRLIAAGFVADDPESVLIIECGELAGEPILPPGVTLRQASAHADFVGIGVVNSRVWNTDLTGVAAELEAEALAAPEEILVFVAEADGEIVSSARLEFNAGTDFAGLWGGSTLHEWRARGIYRALVARRARLARERGVRYLQVDASDASRPILLRLGFQAVTTTTPYVWSPTP